MIDDIESFWEGLRPPREPEPEPPQVEGTPYSSLTLREQLEEELVGRREGVNAPTLLYQALLAAGFPPHSVYLEESLDEAPSLTIEMSPEFHIDFTEFRIDAYRNPFGRIVIRLRPQWLGPPTSQG